MLNIKFTLIGGGGLGRDFWHMTESPQSRVTAASATACLTCYGYIKQYTWAGNYVSYITVLCVQGILILSLLIFMPFLYSHSSFTVHEEGPVSVKNFSFTVHIVYMVVACIIMYCQDYQ